MILKVVRESDQTYYECDHVSKSICKDGATVRLDMIKHGRPNLQVLVGLNGEPTDAFLMSDEGKTIECIGRWNHTPKAH